MGWEERDRGKVGDDRGHLSQDVFLHGAASVQITEDDRPLKGPQGVVRVVTETRDVGRVDRVSSGSTRRRGRDETKGGPLSRGSGSPPVLVSVFHLPFRRLPAPRTVHDTTSVVPGPSRFRGVILRDGTIFVCAERTDPGVVVGRGFSDNLGPLLLSPTSNKRIESEDRRLRGRT